MNKMTWILVSVTALMARTTTVTAIQCYECSNTQYKTCGDPFSLLSSAKTCPGQATQCVKIKVKARGASGEETVIQRGCATPAMGIIGCRNGYERVKLADGSDVQEMGSVCICGKDLCNGGALGEEKTLKAKGNDGEQFQPKLKLLVFAMATAVMKILFN